MQKNNCKLKTIFKKGLSFSIALALGAAATSLNLAKTAYAEAPDVDDARVVYLAGEKVEQIAGATKLKVNGTEVTENPMDHIMATSDTKLNFGDNEEQTNWSTDVAVTVYDWSSIYKSTGVTVEHDATSGKHDDIRNSVVDNLSLTMSNSAHLAKLKESLKGGELQTTGGAKIDSTDYATYNGKAVQIKIGDAVFALGSLTITRSVSSVELESEPTENCYIAGEKINLTGLALKVSYAVGDPEIVKWTEETSDKFTYDNENVEHGAAIKDSVENVSVTYGEQKTKNTFSLFVVSTKTADAAGIAKVTGTVDKLTTVNAIALHEDSEYYTKLKSAFADDANVIYAYDVRADYSVKVGALTVALNVGKNYKGQVVTVKHLTADGVETYVNTVDEDGYVTVQVNALSPFMVVLGATAQDKADAAETEKKNEETVTDEEAAKLLAALQAKQNQAAASKSSSSAVKTGDAAVFTFALFGFVAIICAAVMTFIKNKRARLEK